MGYDLDVVVWWDGVVFGCYVWVVVVVVEYV